MEDVIQKVVCTPSIFTFRQGKMDIVVMQFYPIGHPKAWGIRDKERGGYWQTVARFSQESGTKLRSYGKLTDLAQYEVDNYIRRWK